MAKYPKMGYFEEDAQRSIYYLEDLYMIRIFYSDFRYISFIVCDVCKKPITDLEMALAVNPRGLEQETFLEVLQVHKGDCNDRANEYFGRKSNSMEMKNHLIDIAYNTGLSLEKIAEHLSIEEKIGPLDYS